MQVNDFFRKKRLWIAGGCAAVFLAVITVKFARLAFSPEKEIAPMLQSVERGSIVDRNGKPLAVQTNFYHFGVTPASLTDIPQLAHDIAPLLGMTESDITKKIADASGTQFVYIKKKLDQNTYDELNAIIDSRKYTGIRFDKIQGRTYPEHTLASQLIGYMGEDGSGLSGIEYSMQDILSPVPNAGTAAEPYGQNVYLTIDANLQYKLEKIARAAIQRTQAANIMLIAAEAKTGEILSYISLPSADLNEYASATPEEMIDRPAMSAYEPGSVFKIFTVASVFDAGGIGPADSFYCDGQYEKKTSGGETIRIKCLGQHGWVTAREALEYSCNDALAQISDRMDAETFLAHIHALGFGARTGIELPGETPGSVKNTNDRLWSARSKPTMAIGQEISVSALQMVQAATAIADGGVPVQLTVIKKLANHNGTDAFVHKPIYKKRLFKKSTTSYVLKCMQSTAESGTGSKAHLGDISIGVKTGTAQMADTVHGGYSTTDFLSNCLAVFPVENPEIILYIVIEKAKGETYAGRIVAPVIAEAADTIIDHLGMSRGDAASLEHSGRISIRGSSPITIGQTVPDLTGLSKRDLIPLLDRTDLQVHIKGNGWVRSQNPAPGTPVTENMSIELNLE